MIFVYLPIPTGPAWDLQPKHTHMEKRLEPYNETHLNRSRWNLRLLFFQLGTYYK